MKVKASSELGELLRRGVNALETIAAAAQAITALDRAASSEAERWREYDRLSEPEAVPGHDWVYSSSEGWQLVPDEEIEDSGSTEAVPGNHDFEPLPIPGGTWRYSSERGWLWTADEEIEDSGSTGEASGTMQLDVGTDEARWMGEERRNSVQATRRDGDAERRQGLGRRFAFADSGAHGHRRSKTRRRGDRIPICLPRRQIGDDLHGRREVVLLGEAFDEVTAASDETPDPEIFQVLSEDPEIGEGGREEDLFYERRSPPANRRGETEQRMRTRRRPHDRRKRVKPGWMDDQRSGEERRDDIDLRAGLERRFSDGRREADS